MNLSSVYSPVNKIDTIMNRSIHRYEPDFTNTANLVAVRWGKLYSKEPVNPDLEYSFLSASSDCFDYTVPVESKSIKRIKVDYLTYVSLAGIDFSSVHTITVIGNKKCERDSHVLFNGISMPSLRTIYVYRSFIGDEVNIQGAGPITLYLHTFDFSVRNLRIIAKLDVLHANVTGNMTRSDRGIEPHVMALLRKTYGPTSPDLDELIAKLELSFPSDLKLRIPCITYRNRNYADIVRTLSRVFDLSVVEYLDVYDTEYYISSKQLAYFPNLLTLRCYRLKGSPANSNITTLVCKEGCGDLTKNHSLEYFSCPGVPVKSLEYAPRVLVMDLDDYESMVLMGPKLGAACNQVYLMTDGKADMFCPVHVLVIDKVTRKVRMCPYKDEDSSDYIVSVAIM